MKKPVVAYASIPNRLPITGTIMWGLLLDRLHAPGWAWGIVGTMIAMIWIATIYGLCTQEQWELTRERGGTNPDWTRK